MSQSEFEIVNNISEVCKIVVQVIMFIILWAAIFDIKKAKRNSIVAVLFLCINIGIWFLPCASWFRYAILAVIVAGYSGIFHKKQIGKAVFTMLAFYNFHCLCFLIANSIYMKMTNVWMKSIDGLQDDYEQQVYHSMAAGLSVTVFFYTVLFVVMAVIFCRIVKGMGIMTWQDVIMLSVLNFVGSMIASMVNSLLVVKIDTDVFILFDEKPDLLWKVPMIAVLIFAGEVALIYFWQRYRILLAERQKHFVEEQQVKAMKQRLEEAENFYGSIRKVRHEMKNHMANIKGLAETGQYGEIDEYIQRMDASMQALEYKYATGNAVTDVIINDKWRRAEKAGIQFEVDFRYSVGIPVFDLGIILDNLLDNAIEACEKLERGKGFIRLDLKQKKQFLLLTVENSFDGALSMQEENSLPHTTKQSAQPEIVTEHGIGLKNVHDMAERYYGGIKIKVKKDVFHVTVMLQQEGGLEMNVNGIGQNYYQNNMAATKSTKGINSAEKADGFAGKVAEKRSVSPEDMTLEEYKKYFKEKMDSLYVHPSQRNRNEVIDITDAAYKRMQTDPEYEKKILDCLAQNWAVDFGGNIPEISYMHIDDTWEKCYGYTQGMKENVGYSRSSSTKGANDAVRQKKARQKKLQEEYLEKRARMKEFQRKALDEKIAKQELERSRLSKAWGSKQQMAKASSAYEANIMTETAVGNEV